MNAQHSCCGLESPLSVNVELTGEQYTRILQLTLMMGLDPVDDFASVARTVICDSLDMRIAARMEAQGRYCFGRY